LSGSLFPFLGTEGLVEFYPFRFTETVSARVCPGDGSKCFMALFLRCGC
jgi:hypothetical protein